ncbi:hypothetical protein [Zavarzinia sp. CC-PAN008]|uniref:hypothetical protein n=1 Tax=Zavarzinia sp. CC-PAN008 TaxID=3243332 RepID=UPI003F744F32
MIMLMTDHTRECIPLAELRVALAQAIHGIRPHKRSRAGGAAEIAHQAAREAEITAAVDRVLVLLSSQGWEVTRPTRVPDLGYAFGHGKRPGPGP